MSLLELLRETYLQRSRMMPPIVALATCHPAHYDVIEIHIWRSVRRTHFQVHSRVLLP